MSIGIIIATLSKVATITSTVQSILELIDQVYSESEKERKKEYLKQLELLCQKGLNEYAKTRILSPEEEKIIREALSENKLDNKQSLLCKLALENNLTAIEMIVKNLKKD